MTEDSLVKMYLDGRVIHQGELGPSSEIKMHLRIYLENPAVRGVTHAHPPICTSFAIAGISLDKAIYPEALVNLGTVPCVHYETPGSPGLPDSIAPFCRDYNALLLANHGAVSWGTSLMEAFYRLESMEHYATVLMYTGNIIGKANVLSCDQVQELLDIRTRMGIHAGGVPPCAPRPSNVQDVLAGHSPLGDEGKPEIKTYRPSESPAAASKENGAGAGGLSPEDIERVRQAVIARLRGL